MDAELKAKWVAALRSGEFEQGRGQLRNGTQYCCLGVLANVADMPLSPDGEHIAGANGYEPLRTVIGSGREIEALWRLNDCTRASFDLIADYIEEHL